MDATTQTRLTNDFRKYSATPTLSLHNCCKYFFALTTHKHHLEM